MQQIQKVLFVYLGNICRSPSAEAVFRKKAKQQGLALEFDSAGTLDYHQGERIWIMFQTLTIKKLKILNWS